MIVLVLGGTRSGKSAIAEKIVSGFGNDVSYLATAEHDRSDADFVSRVDAHRARRPAEWRTVECGSDLVGALRSASGPVLIDSVGAWVAAHHDFDIDTESLCSTLTSRVEPTVLVSEEVAMGVHAATELGRLFTDTLGRLNQNLAHIADRALLVVAGRVLELPQEFEFKE
ncbi:MAG: bifunctional adenosylcobinamide kinase/adenosylcobinamide-phosphate guanylyltransferase [Acidimicrobiales bacterium]